MKILLKARIGNGPEHLVGSQEFTKEEWTEELEGRTEEEWLQNTGADWAYDAVHSDCLQYWAELSKNCIDCGRELNGYKQPICRYCDGTAE